MTDSTVNIPTSAQLSVDPSDVGNDRSTEDTQASQTRDSTSYVSRDQCFPTLDVVIFVVFVNLIVVYYPHFFILLCYKEQALDVRKRSYFDIN